ncbi:MAG: hypothetical protein INR65_09330, partial [Gluconacetobacter diazotrophicus]|nr:hypothetical protein [Gluconacetobacter diazotrophicus]
EVRFTAVRLRSRQGDLAGDGRIRRRAGAVPAVEARLRSDRLDADALFPPARSDRTPFSLDTPLPFARLRGPDLSLDWRIAHLNWHAQDWSGLHPVLFLRDAALDLSLPDGLLRGRLIADGAKTAPPVSLVLGTPDLPLPVLAEFAKLPGPVTGTLAIDTKLSGRGDTPRALLSTLDGTLSVSTAGASLSDAALGKLAGPAITLLGSTLPADGRTPIRCFGISGGFANGVGRFPTIALSSPPLTLSGSGEIDLVHDTLLLRLHPLAKVLGSRVSVPVVVDGSLSAPHGRLDADGLDKVGIALDALFGGDHPRTCSQAGLSPSAAANP